MTSPSQSDRMESHLWADRTNPQNGCKNTTNDRRSGKNTHAYTHRHTHTLFIIAEPNHIMVKRIREFNSINVLSLRSVSNMISLSETDDS